MSESLLNSSINNTDKIVEPTLTPTDENQTLSSTSQQKQPMPRIIFFAIIYGLVLYGVAGYFFFKKKIEQQQVKTIQTNTEIKELPPFFNVETTGTSSSSSYMLLTAMKTDTLPLIVLKPEVLPTSATPSMYFKPVSVVLPDDIAKKLSLYKLGDLLLAGPKGWYAAGGIYEYGIFVNLYSTPDKSFSKPYIKIHIIPKGHRLGLQIASQYFQWVHTHAKELMVENDLFTPITTGSSSALTKHLIYLSDTSFNQSGLETYGFAFSDGEANLQNRQWATIFMEINTTKEDREFAKAIINIFIQQYDLMNK